MADVKKLAEELVGLTILEAKELNDILKDEYGIEPAAAAVVAGPAGGGGEAAEAKTDFDVVMTSFGGNKIAVIKEVRAITGSHCFRLKRGRKTRLLFDSAKIVNRGRKRGL